MLCSIVHAFSISYKTKILAIKKPVCSEVHCQYKQLICCSHIMAVSIVIINCQIIYHAVILKYSNTKEKTLQKKKYCLYV